MVGNALESARIAAARSYLTLFESLSDDWESHYATYVREPDVATGLALAHPSWYEAAVRLAEPDPRGPRAFAPPPGRSQTCDSSLVWGYSCELRSDGLQADHHFPFQSGGPSDPRNIIYLCRLHNQGKSCDVHLFAWEKGVPTWLGDLLQRVERRRAVLRHR